MISRFFFPEPLPGDGEIALPDAIAHHATRVLRLREGSEVVLFDGLGGERFARLSSRGGCWHAQLGAYAAVERESPLELVLVQALAAGDKMDWVVQKAVELGVSEIRPVQAERSVMRLAGERAVRRGEHWQQVAVAACEQSGRNRVPVVHPICALRDYLSAHRAMRRVVLDPGAPGRLAELPPPAAALHVLVGPEGGWSDAEQAAFGAAACEAVRVGPRILRTETAGLALLAAAQALWGDL